MIIQGRSISAEDPCYIIAEAGLAHEGLVQMGRDLIDLAYEAGADAVKFQVYKTEELISKERAPDWFARFKRKELSYSEFEKLKGYADDLGITWFATPHTIGAFRFLMELGVPAMKVGSGERGDVLDAVINCDLPAFISTGMRTYNEFLRTISRLIPSQERALDVCFLHCVSAYPPAPRDLNLGVMDMVYGLKGYSDHYPGTKAVEIAVAMGAKVIEKHIKLPESEGQDTEGALFGHQFWDMVQDIKKIEAMLGSGEREFTAEERETAKWALKGEDGLRPM